MHTHTAICNLHGRYGDLQLLDADDQGGQGEVYFGRVLKGVHLGETVIAKKCPVGVSFALYDSDIARLQR